MSNCKIGIIDYKAGNAPSVLNALKKQNIQAELVSSKAELKKMTALILPGVGSAGATMRSLAELSCKELLCDLVQKEGIPFLGICVGLQILFEHSEEEDTSCLALLPGRVRKFNSSAVRVPQMGWNSVDFTKASPILDGLNPSEYFYFVNSYYAEPADKEIVLATTNYGSNFCSMVQKGNITATQFHLEKSGEVGLKLLQNFAKQGGFTC